jgi:hypothetical protein
MKNVFILLISLLLSACYGINSETSEIANIHMSCLDSLAWEKVCMEYDVNDIRDPELQAGLKEVRNHFIKPKYVLYFDEAPKEIIGCDWHTVRVVYNAAIADQAMSGLSPFLSNQEQKRIRNRVLSALMQHQCAEGKKETVKAMAAPVPFAESHKDYPLPQSPAMMDAVPEDN